MWASCPCWQTLVSICPCTFGRTALPRKAGAHGKVWSKHITRTCGRWIQQRLWNCDFSLYKVSGEKNPGDLFTKTSLPQQEIPS